LGIGNQTFQAYKFNIISFFQKLKDDTFWSNYRVPAQQEPGALRSILELTFFDQTSKSKKSASGSIYLLPLGKISSLTPASTHLSLQKDSKPMATNNILRSGKDELTWTMSWFLSRSILDKVRSTVLEFLNFSISLRNFASFTGNPPSSEIMDPGSRPTSSTKTRPKRSKVKRQRPEIIYQFFKYPFLRSFIALYTHEKLVPKCFFKTQVLYDSLAS